MRRYESVKVEKLMPYINNTKKHSKEQIKKIQSSIREFGFVNPILIDSNYNIIAGHGRLEGAKEEGLKEIPCLFIEDLTEQQIKAYRIADNKIAEFAEWDMELLEIELEGLDDVFTGFDDAEFDDIMGIDKEVEEDDFEVEVPDEPISKRGDIWKLGRHRLMCGDSTIVSDIDVLMNGKKADMLFTDPPYNINYKGVNDDRQIMNDKMSDEDFTKFISDAISFYPTMYVCCSWQFVALFKKAMENNGVPPKAMIVWDKINPAQHLDKYFKRHELILYYGEFGGHKTLRGDVWELKRQRNTLHPTMKPIELIAMAIEDNPKANIIYDAFGGSGSTLIACEQLGRICYMMELDPKYVDVIINRWEQYTGQKAVLISE